MIGKKQFNCMRFTISTIMIVLLLPVFILPAASASAADPCFFWRVGMGLAISEDTAFHDKNSASTDPPALFGDAVGEDGRSIGARGDLGESFMMEGGVRWQSDWFHSEVIIGWRPGLEFSGDANFLNVPLNQQPVDGDVTSLTAMISWIADLERISPVFQWGPVSPFVGVSAGVGYNRIDRMTYRFPTIADDAVTITPDGDWSGFVYGVTGGLEYMLSKNTSIELAYRYCDAGKIETDTGSAHIVRPGNTLDLTIAPTEADLSLHEILLSVVYFF